MRITRYFDCIMETIIKRNDAPQQYNYYTFVNSPNIAGCVKILIFIIQTDLSGHFINGLALRGANTYIQIHTNIFFNNTKVAHIF